MRFLTSCSCRVRVELVPLCSSACLTHLLFFLARADCDHDSQNTLLCKMYARTNASRPCPSPPTTAYTTCTMTRARRKREAICLAEQPSHVRPARAAGTASASGSSAAHTAPLEQHGARLTLLATSTTKPSNFSGCSWKRPRLLTCLSSRWSGRYVRPNSLHPDPRASLKQQ
jgi:hypothetical protein